MATALKLISDPYGYSAAGPFPHVVLDGFFEPGRMKQAASDARSIQGILSSEFYGQKRKAGTSDLTVLGPTLSGMIHEMSSPAFLSWLEELTGIEDLHPDPALFGGGLHQVASGGFLKVHADFSWHAAMQMHRRVNVIVYLNEDWQDDWGGHLELWHTDMSSCAAKVAPVANRMVVFSTNPDSFHGHPDPLACPEETVRSSLALYYYTVDPAPGAVPTELTDYRPRTSERFGLRHLLHQMKIRRRVRP